MSAEIIDGRKIAQKIREEAKRELELLFEKTGVIPNITTIKIGNNDESELYLKLRDKACKEVGINSIHKEFREDVSEKCIIKTINELKNDKDVHGILIQYPLPEDISEQKIIQNIDPIKDVEGLTPYNLGNTFLGYEDVVPITPLAVLKILEYEDIELKGKNIVIVNHSNVVGKPLASLMLNRNATVSICHVYTKYIQQFTRSADIIISGAGVLKLIKPEIIKKDSIVIDVAIVATKDGIFGDVDFDLVKEVAAKITPVPGGVGPVTVACSLKNMIKTTKNCIGEIQI